MAKFNLQAFVDEEALKAIESLRQERDELRAENEHLLKLLEAVVNPDEDIDSVYSKIKEVVQ